MFKPYTETLKKMHFDMHTPQAVKGVGSKLDIDDFVRSIKLSKAESVTWFARCAYGFSYFPTKYGEPHPGMTKDIFKEVSEALKKEHIDTTAYFACCKMADYTYQKNNKTDWLNISKDGKHYTENIGDDIVHGTCITSGFMTDVLLNTILECARNYDINGVWLDGLYHYAHKPCHCDRCRAEFAKAYPNEKFEGRILYKWVFEKIWEFLNLVGTELKKIDERLTVGSDTIGCINWSKPIPEHVGFITYDPPTENSSFSFSLQLAQACWRGVPSDMNIERMNRWNNFNCRPVESILTDSAVCASMNSLLVTGDMIESIELKPQDSSMKLIASAYDYGEKIYDKVKDVISYADVAILSSPEQIRDNDFSEYSPKSWKIDLSKFESAYQNVLSAGMNAHVLYDDDIKENVSRYQAVIIPQIRYIGEHASIELEKYVANGGKLIIVGDIPKSVKSDKLTETASREIFEKLCGLEFKEYEDVKVSYMNIENTKAEKYIKDTIISPFFVAGKPCLTKVTSAEVESNIYSHAISYQFGSLPLGKESEYPSITKNTYGKGSVIFIAQPLLTFYAQTGNHLCKKLMEGILNDNVSPCAKLCGPSNSQLVFAKEDNKMCVSVILYHNDLRSNSPRITDNIGAIAGISVHIDDKRVPVSVTSVMGDEIKYTCDENGIDINFPPFKIYSGVVIEF